MISTKAGPGTDKNGNQEIHGRKSAVEQVKRLLMIQGGRR